MRTILPSVVVVLGVGLFVFGISAYAPAGSGDFAGWSESCRNVMTVGAMLATGGWLWRI